MRPSLPRPRGFNITNLTAPAYLTIVLSRDVSSNVHTGPRLASVHLYGAGPSKGCLRGQAHPLPYQQLQQCLCERTVAYKRSHDARPQKALQVIQSSDVLLYFFTFFFMKEANTVHSRWSRSEICGHQLPEDAQVKLMTHQTIKIQSWPNFFCFVWLAVALRSCKSGLPAACCRLSVSFLHRRD